MTKLSIDEAAHRLECKAYRIWIIDDEPSERQWLREKISWAASANGWHSNYYIQEFEDGAAWIRTIDNGVSLGDRDWIVADGMIGDDPTKGAMLVRAHLGTLLATGRLPSRPRLLMITGQSYERMRCAFSIGNYSAVSLTKPDERDSYAFQVILTKFLAGQFDQLIDFAGGVVDVFDQAPNQFFRSMLTALGETAPESVALCVPDIDAFREGPLQALEDGLRTVLGNAFRGMVDSKDVDELSLRHIVMVGRPGAWLTALAARTLRQEGVPLEAAAVQNTMAFLRRLGTQVDYTWVELSDAVARVRIAAREVPRQGFRLSADDLLPKCRWVATADVETRKDDAESERERERRVFVLKAANGSSWVLGRQDQLQWFLLLLMDVARKELCRLVDAGDPIGDWVELPFDRVMEVGYTYVTPDEMGGIRNRGKRPPFQLSCSRIKEGIKRWDLLSTQLEFDKATLLTRVQRIRVPVHWAFNSIPDLTTSFRRHRPTTT